MNELMTNEALFENYINAVEARDDWYEREYDKVVSGTLKKKKKVEYELLCKLACKAFMAYSAQQLEEELRIRMKMIKGDISISDLNFILNRQSLDVAESRHFPKELRLKRTDVIELLDGYAHFKNRYASSRLRLGSVELSDAYEIYFEFEHEPGCLYRFDMKDLFHRPALAYMKDIDAFKKGVTVEGATGIAWDKPMTWLDDPKTFVEYRFVLSANELFERATFVCYR